MVTAISTASNRVMSCVNVGGAMDSPYADLVLSLAGLSYVIGSLHPYERVHLDPKGLFDAQRHVAGKIGAAVQQVRQRRPGNAKRRRGGRNRQPRGLDYFGSDEVSRMGRIFQWHGASPQF